MSAPPTGHARLWEPTTATWARWKLMLSVPILAILVPTNFLALLAGTLALSWRRSPPVTVTVAALYVGWVGATDSWKNRAGQVGPEWLAQGVRKVLAWGMEGVGCSCRIIMEHSPEPSERYVCCYNPHGAFATAGICFAMSEFRLHPELRRLQGNLLGASALFYVPVLRELLLILGVRDASKRNIAEFLEGGRSIGMQPGGVWEQLHTNHMQEQCFVMKRMGFMRLAMKYGRDIVPLYAFGENSLYTTYDIGLGLRQWVARTMRLGVPIVSGRLGFFPLVPFATRVTIVSGRPVRVGPPNPNPTDAELMALLAAYDAELQTIFRDHGPTSLPADIAANGLLVRWRGAGGEAVGAGAAVAKETKPRASAVRSLQ